MPVLSILQIEEPSAPPSEDPTIFSVCLATGFFPKSSKNPMELTVAKTGEETQNRSIPTDNAALSNSKTYFFAGFAKNGEAIETCSLNNAKITKEPQIEKVDPPAPEPTAGSPVEDCKQDNYTIPDSGGSPKVNFMSVVVNCLRILFAKTVTFNMLLTVKAVVF